ncbi:MAG: SusD/RagB family nutrient-binding outer membrane lipoprotein [Saprospiraceae bacterium]
MKNTFSKIVLILLAVVMINTSCDDGFAELNIDPTVANEIDPRFQFTWVQLRTSGERYENWRAALIYSSTMIQHLATDCGYWSGDKYSFNAGYSASLWDRGYPQQVKEIEDLVATLESGAQGTQEMLGIAKIWRTLIYHRMTDLYGDIPYSQAGRGFLEGIDNPVYDAQEDIYAGMLADLEEGLALISGDGGFGSADLFYGGDSDQWRRFGNSMMLRLGMRMSEVDPSGAQAWVQKAIAGGVMESIADDAFIQHTQGPGGINQNGLGEVLDLSNGSANENCPRISKTFMDWMMNGNDPRMEIIAEPSVDDGVYKGMPNGLDAQLLGANGADTLREDFSRVNQALVQVSDPMVFMTYAETELLLAEAAMRGWHNGNAADHYNAGVKAAMQMLVKFDDSFVISDAEVDAYLAANPFVEAEGMRQIGEQFWAATFLNEYEAYANFRRTGYPELTPVDFPGNESNSQIPLRLRYPQSEYGVNGANIEAANARQGADQFTTPVWWDK